MNARTSAWTVPIHLVSMLAAASGAAPAFEWRDAADDGATLAWVRFDGSTYRDVGYQFLGAVDVDVRFDVAPAPGMSVDLHWGSKKDTRGAEVIVGVHTQRVEAGGHDGFRWLRLPLPAGLTDGSVTIRLREAPPKAMFLAEARLVGAAPAAAGPDLKAASHRATATFARAGSGPDGEAFPEMRPVWDREPPPAPAGSGPDEALFRAAERHGRQANEAFYRSRRFIDGWLAHADPVTGLIPRNLRESRDYWNGRDAAADNYPFMVLTAAMTDRPLFDGRMLDMLRTETRLTRRIGALPDDYCFTTRGFRHAQPDLNRLIFDGSEYVKDGLMPVTEWLGPSPWSERMIAIVDSIVELAPHPTAGGPIPSDDIEVNGEMMQVLSRLTFMRDNPGDLDMACRIADYYLLGDRHPTRDFASLKLRDHGCELISGLTEVYAACHAVRPDKAAAYRAPLHEMLDRILEIGVNEHGLMFDAVNPQTGKVLRERLSDNWGYNYNGYYTVVLLDGVERYREATRKAMRNLAPHYLLYNWEGNFGADGFADSVEGAINLMNREPDVPRLEEWIDANMGHLLRKQKPDGVIEGWHGDGNYARTALLWALWKTQGVTIRPWREDVRFGSVASGDGRVRLTFIADQPWSGVVIFDRPRHREFMKLPFDYPRINQFPEWFTVREEDRCIVRAAGGASEDHPGRALREGLPLKLSPGVEVRWIVEKTVIAPAQ